jgi:hypothetical protein
MTHPFDPKAWVVPRNDVQMQADDMSPPGKTFKLQPFLLQSEFDLALADPLPISLQGRAYLPLAPLKLRVFGDGYNLTYGTGSDIVVVWSGRMPWADGGGAPRRGRRELGARSSPQP